jgi:hypothetical protein
MLQDETRSVSVNDKSISINDKNASPAAETGSGEMGERVAVFVDRVANGVPPEDAARLAGYSDPVRVSQDLLRLPHIRKALAATFDGRLLSEAAPLAIQVALEILSSGDAPASIRGKMAIAVLDRIKDKAAAPAAGDGRGLGDLSAEELAAFVGRLEEAGAVVVPLDVTPRTPA